MKLYAVCDGPPSLACRMTLKHLKIPFELIEVNFNVGEHLTDDYAKVRIEIFVILKSLKLSWFMNF